MEKFATGGFPKHGNLFIQTDSILLGELKDKKAISHNEKIIDSIAKAVTEKLSPDLLNFDYFPMFPQTKGEVE